MELGYELARDLKKAENKSTRSDAAAKRDKVELDKVAAKQRVWRRSMPKMSRGKAMRIMAKNNKRRKAEQAALDAIVNRQCHKMPSSRKKSKKHYTSDTDWESSSGFESDSSD